MMQIRYPASKPLFLGETVQRTITRYEIEAARHMRDKASKAFVDMYLAYAIDHVPVESGGDIGCVVSALYEMNLADLKGPLRWATLLLLQNQIELSIHICKLRFDSIAHRSAWREIPGEVWRSLRAILTVAPIYVRRRLSPLHSPVFSPAEWARLQALK